MGQLNSAHGAGPDQLNQVSEDPAQLAAQFVQQGGMPKIESGPEELARKFMEQQTASAAQPTAEPPPEEPGLGMQTLDAAGRVLDYPGGFMRAGLAETAGLAMGKGSIVKEEDLKQAAKGKGPVAAEYLRRLGVPEGFTVDTPAGKVSARGTAGLALDIATDPLTALTKLAKSVPYIGKIINAPGIASEAVGEAIYKAGLKKVDAKLAAKGEGAVSDILLEEGKAGSSAKLAQDVENMSNTMGKLRQGLYDRATQLGIGVDTAAAKFGRAESVLEKMKLNPGLSHAAGELEGMLNAYKQSGLVPLEVISEWKTSLYDSLPASAFSGQGKLRGQAMQFKRALASDLRQAIVDAGNKGEKGLGDSVAALNDKWGTLLAAKKPMAQQAQSAANARFGDWIDATIIGGGLAGGHSNVGAGALAAKKAFELANTTYAKTKFGKALVDAGRNGVANALARRAVILPGQPPEGETP